MITPMNRNHAMARIPFSRLQVRHSSPETPGDGWVLGGVPGVPPGALPAFSTCIGTVSVLVHDGSLLSVAVKLTVNV